MQKDANLVELEKCCRTHILNYFLAKFRFDDDDDDKSLPVIVSIWPCTY